MIESFGNFLVSGSIAVRFRGVRHLVVINFVVITKGGGSHCRSRGALRAGLHARQTARAVDADLNAGFYRPGPRAHRRADIDRESILITMDGASQSSGTGVPWPARDHSGRESRVGGSRSGLPQHDLGVIEGAGRYALLTVGDGLVQIQQVKLPPPASWSAVHRRTGSVAGVFQPDFRYQTLFVASAVLGVLGLIPRYAAHS